MESKKDISEKIVSTTERAPMINTYESVKQLIEYLK